MKIKTTAADKQLRIELQKEGKSLCGNCRKVLFVEQFYITASGKPRTDCISCTADKAKAKSAEKAADLDPKPASKFNGGKNNRQPKRSTLMLRMLYAAWKTGRDLSPLDADVKIRSRASFLAAKAI